LYPYPTHGPRVRVYLHSSIENFIPDPEPNPKPKPNPKCYDTLKLKLMLSIISCPVWSVPNGMAVGAANQLSS